VWTATATECNCLLLTASGGALLGSQQQQHTAPTSSSIHTSSASPLPSATDHRGCELSAALVSACTKHYQAPECPRNIVALRLHCTDPSGCCPLLCLCPSSPPPPLPCPSCSALPLLPVRCSSRVQSSHPGTEQRTHSDQTSSRARKPRQDNHSTPNRTKTGWATLDSRPRPGCNLTAPTDLRILPLTSSNHIHTTTPASRTPAQFLPVHRRAHSLCQVDKRRAAPGRLPHTFIHSASPVCAASRLAA